jgi:hypothetical protein
MVKYCCKQKKKPNGKGSTSKNIYLHIMCVCCMLINIEKTKELFMAKHVNNISGVAYMHKIHIDVFLE